MMGYHKHICLFCRALYDCYTTHKFVYLDTPRIGSRCCPECRHLNARAIKRLDVLCDVSNDRPSHVD